MIESMLGANPAVTTLPIGSEDNFEGVIDLVAMKAITWTGEVHTILVNEGPPLALGGPHHLCLPMFALAASRAMKACAAEWYCTRLNAFCAERKLRAECEGISW